MAWENHSICLVEDAGSLWIKENPCNSSTYREFLAFEKQFNDHFNELVFENGFCNAVIPGIADDVVVCINHRWYRAIVQEINRGLNTTTALSFLVDIGKYIKIDIPSLVILEPYAWSSVPFQAKRIELLNIVPISLDYDIKSQDFDLKLRVAENWDKSATDFVKAIEKLKPKCEFEYVRRLVDASYGGCLSLEVTASLIQTIKSKHSNITIDESLFSNDKVSLADILIAYKYGQSFKHPTPQKMQLSLTPITESKAVSPVPMSSTRRSRGKEILDYIRERKSKGASGQSFSSIDVSTSSIDSEAALEKSPIDNLVKTQLECSTPNNLPCAPEADSTSVSSFGELDSVTDTENETKTASLNETKQDSPKKVGRNPKLRRLSGANRVRPRRKLNHHTEPDSDCSEQSSEMNQAICPKQSPEPKTPRSIELCKSGKKENSNILRLDRLCRVYNSGGRPVHKSEVMLDSRDKMSYFNPKIIQILKKYHPITTSLQSFMWPAVLKGYSCFVIGGHASGKTLGYVVPSASTLLDTFQSLSSKLENKLGPVMIILCSGWKNVKHTSHCLRQLLPTCNIKVKTTWGGTGVNKLPNLKREILTGCDVLITTLPMLSRLIEESNKSFEKDELPFLSLQTCCYMIIDDADYLLQNSGNQFSSVIKDWSELTKNYSKRQPRQLIFVGSQWNDGIDSLYKTFNPKLNANVIISSHFEAAVACRVPTTVHYIPPDEDFHNAVLKVVRDQERVIIFVSSVDEVKRYLDLLGAIAISAIAVATALKYEAQPKVSLWHSSSDSVLIVCEDAVHQLIDHDLRNARCIIHTDIPKRVVALGRKYSFMLDSYGDVGGNECNARSHIFLTDNQIKANPHVIEAISRLTSMPDVVYSLMEEGFADRNAEIKSIGLCPQLMATGNCCIPNCTWRHRITENDIPHAIPMSGSVKFEILEVLTASRFNIRLISWQSAQGSCPEDIIIYYHTLFMNLDKYFSVHHNCVKLTDMEVGVICVTLYKSTWVRAKIMKVDYQQTVPLVTLLLIDEGFVIDCCTTEDLFQLPSRFKSMPQMAIEAFLCNVSPIDHDADWTDVAVDFVKSIKDSSGNDETCFEGKVSLSLGKTLWLKPVCKIVKFQDTYISDVSIRSLLLKHKYGMDNPQHLVLLKKLCQDKPYLVNGLSSSLVDLFEAALADMEPESDLSGTLSTEAPEEGNPGASSLDISKSDFEYYSNNDISCSDNCENLDKKFDLDAVEEFNLNESVMVECGKIESPRLFYVTKCHRNSELEDLQDHITELVDKLPKSHNLSVGDLCLAVDLNDEYSRGKVISISDNSYEVFFIDYGDKEIIPRDKIRSYPYNKINHIPAQAIACELGHVHVPEALLKEATKIMDDVLDESESWFITPIDIKKDGAKDIYVIEMTNHAREPPTQLWTELVAKRVAIKVTDGTNLSDQARCLTTETSQLREVETLGDNNEAVETVSRNCELVERSEDDSEDAVIADNINTRINQNKTDNGPNIPSVTWVQDIWKIVIVIKLRLTNDYELRVSERHLSFSAVVTNVKYEIDEELFGSIDRNGSSSQGRGEEVVKVTLYKKESGLWKRLLKKVDRTPWLRYGNSDDSFFAEESEMIDFSSIRTPPKYIGGAPDLSGSDNSDSESSLSSSSGIF